MSLFPLNMSFIATLQQILSPEQCLLADMGLSYQRDHRGRYQGNADAVVFPETTQQVVDVVTLCQQHQIAIVPQGGNTSLCGASVPCGRERQIVLNLSRMNKIRSIDAVNYSMTVDAGCTLSQVVDAASQVQRLFPLGLTAIAHRCEIGGNIATNAGGISVMRYGNMRDLVLGLEVVLPDGRVWQSLKALRKDNTGYDLKHLFIGSEGTLGVITAATLRLYPKPQATASACVALETPEQAVALLTYLREHSSETLTAFELISRSCFDLVLQHIQGAQEPFAERYPYYVLIKLDSCAPVSLLSHLTQTLQKSPVLIQAYACSDVLAQLDAWWLLRRSISDAQKQEGLSIKHDISVPVDQVAVFISRANQSLQQSFAGVRIVAFGHMGDGNIHYNVSKFDSAANLDFIAQHEADVNQIVYDIVHQLGGSISAEHGLGQLKRETIKCYKSPLELALMAQIKQVFDPNLRLNPNKVL